MRRLAAAVAIGAALVAVPFPSRADDANRACDDGQGVTVVVDFQALGGGVNVRCAPQPISNGFDVFRNANVGYETVTNSDFVCRLAGKPENADCSHTPPGNAYWSYWYARPGQEWHYSPYGPGSRKPPPGSYDGWSFITGDKAPPRYPVPPAPAPPSTTTTTTAAGVAGAAAPSTTARVRGADAPRVTTLSSPVTATSTTLLVDALSRPDATTTAVPLGHVDLTETHGGSGTSTGFVLSGVAVALVGALAVAFLRGRGR